jgi:hypothetical protein
MDLEILVISELDAYSVGDLNISLAYYVLKNPKLQIILKILRQKKRQSLKKAFLVRD